MKNIKFVIVVLFILSMNIIAREINFTFIDQNNQYLNDINILMDMSKIKGTWNDLEGLDKKQQHLIATNNFKYIIDESLYGITFTFSKSGYISEKYYLSVFDSNKNKNIYQKIKLISLKNQSHVIKHRLKLSFHNDTQQQEFLCIKSLSNDQVVYTNSPANSGNYIVLNTLKDKDGNTSLKPRSDFNKRLYPEKLLLQLIDNNENVGFQKAKETRFKYLLKAPEKNYIKTLEIDPRNYEIYFYMKLNNKYGKGKVVGFHILPNQKYQLLIECVINLQPNERNLQSKFDEVIY